KMSELEGFGLLAEGYRLTETQAQASLDMRLQRLTGLEQDKIHGEYEGLLEAIAAFIEILVNPDRLREVVLEELEKVRADYHDERRTEICQAAEDINILDLIADEQVVVTLSHRGYIKYQQLGEYQAQKRGGRGKSAAKV